MTSILKGVSGVHTVKVDFASGIATVTGNGENLEDDLLDALENGGTYKGTVVK